MSIVGWGMWFRMMGAGRVLVMWRRIDRGRLDKKKEREESSCIPPCSSITPAEFVWPGASSILSPEFWKTATPFRSTPWKTNSASASNLLGPAPVLLLELPASSTFHWNLPPASNLLSPAPKILLWKSTQPARSTYWGQSGLFSENCRPSQLSHENRRPRPKSIKKQPPRWICWGVTWPRENIAARVQSPLKRQPPRWIYRGGCLVK